MNVTGKHKFAVTCEIGQHRQRTDVVEDLFDNPLFNKQFHLYALNYRTLARISCLSDTIFRTQQVVKVTRRRTASPSRVSSGGASVILSNTRFLGPTLFSRQTAFRTVQSLLHCCPVCPTVRQMYCTCTDTQIHRR